MTNQIITVEPFENGLSLLQFLKGRLSYSGKAVKRAIDANGCYINGKIERFSSFRVKRGDRVTIAIEKGERVVKSEFPILYQDDSLCAFNKSAFVSCNSSHTLHRLDKETSGVLLTSEDRAYYDLFRNREMGKVYLAVVEGTPKDDDGIIDSPIGVKKRYDGHKIMHISPNGKEAITRYHVVKKKNGLTVLALFPKTGRTHQIRVHLSSINLPILGDYDYNKGTSKVASRMLLHAYQIRFIHPHTKNKTVIEAPIPEDMLPYITKDEVLSLCFP